jgi:hypothetical protein
MSYTRREIGKIALATVAVPSVFQRVLDAQAAVQARKINGVTLGAITYSFNRIAANPQDIIKAYSTIGLTEVELMSNHAEALAGLPAMPTFGRGGGGRITAPPAGAAPGAAAPAAPPAPAAGAPAAPAAQGGGRGAPLTPEQEAEVKAAQEAQRKWRTSTSPSTWSAVRKMWNDAGVELRLLTYNMGATMTDEMIEYGFTMAKGLGVRAISTSTQVSTAKRIAPFAEKHNMIVGVHGHANVGNPNEISTEETFLAAFEASKNIWANLDIGHYTATDGDAVAFIQKHHARITNLHLKDRKNRTNGGANMPEWGQGDTPIKAVLQLLKKGQWDIAANIEFETPGDPLVEVAKQFKLCQEYLA